MSTAPESVYVVQFPHPGSEHKPRTEVMPWNQGPHHRKFLVADGTAQDADGQPQRDRYAFWGEWEAPSRVIDRWPTQGQLPQYLHRPFWSRPPAGERQNTDPWVFGDRFRYSNCKQLGPRPHRKPSALQRLTPGSVVLFGSQLAGDFVLDTVLVVADATSYTPGDGPHLDLDQAFATCTLDSLGADNNLDYREFTLFTGATPHDPIGGMFSFVPCRPAEGDPRFARPAITVPGVVNPASKQAPSGARRPLPPSRAKEVWDDVRWQVLDHDLLLGTHFDTPLRGA